ncbi:MAG: DUF3108 domain-containing protein [Pseudomonadota bacterium]|nr:DUF3108 domain-containing protein [Pseudomonadota bacterium]
MSASETIQAVEGDHFDTVYYHPETKELGGTFKNGFRNLYQGNHRFTYTGELGVGIFDALVSKNIGSEQELARAAGFDKNDEFDKLAQIQELTATEQKVATSQGNLPFRLGEKSVLQMSYLGLSAGELTLEVSRLIKIRGKLALELRVQLKSSESFKLFRINDVITTYVELGSWQPLAMSVIYDETTRYGSLYMLSELNGKARYWENAVERGGRRTNKKSESNFIENSQLAGSALFFLRTLPLSLGQEKSFNLADHEHLLKVNLRTSKDEVLLLPVGTRPTTLLELNVKPNESHKKPVSIKLWLLKDPSRQIVKISVDLKVGAFEALAKELL